MILSGRIFLFLCLVQDCKQTFYCHIVVHRMEFDRTRWSCSWKSDHQMCTKLARSVGDMVPRAAGGLDSVQGLGAKGLAGVGNLGGGGHLGMVGIYRV